MNPRIKILLPLIVSFFVLTIAVVVAKLVYAGLNIDYTVLMVANCLFFLVSLFVFGLQYKAMHNSNPNVFIRSVMSGMIIKVFACVGAIVAYYFISGEHFNKPAVYVSMVIYVIYLVVEVRTIMKLNRNKNG